MLAGQWERVQELFEAVVARSPKDRAAYLAEACKDDAELRAEVESLLEHDARASSEFLLPPRLGSGAARGSADDAPDPLIGKRVNKYLIKKVIGSGGMGTVYAAEQIRPSRIVALKVMRAWASTRSALRRFEYESEILARLTHPHIAQIYEAGTHRDPEAGRGVVPFFAMEYIRDARPFIAYADEKNLGTRARLELFTQVCDAVHHGHQRGVIHRDLKPGNILVDSSGQVKVIDFGVARLTDSDIAVTTIRTDVGQLIGTLQYMSPEQCDANVLGLDTRSDVYALGVLAYELLTGRLPYDARSETIYRATKVIRESTPPRPSSINPKLRGDVETVVLKAMEKDRDRRYQSASDFADDIRRYLNKAPINARPPSMYYQLSLLARRNKAAVGALAGVFVALLFALAGISWAYTQTRAARDESRKNEHEARWKAYVAGITAAELAFPLNDFAMINDSLNRAPREFRDWEWSHLHAETDHSLKTISLDTSSPESHSFFNISPDGRRLATGMADGSICLWSTATGEKLVTLPGDGKQMQRVTLNRDGSRIATRTLEGIIRIWDVATSPEIRATWQPGTSRYPPAFSADGARVASVSSAGLTCVLDTLTNREVCFPPIPDTPVFTVALSWDGTHMASGLADDTIRLWDLSSNNEPRILTGHSADVKSLSFSPDGMYLASGSSDGTVRLWSTADGVEVRRMDEEGEIPSSVSFSADGSRLLSRTINDHFRVWEVATGNRIAAIRTRGHSPDHVTFTPDGEGLVSGCHDGTVTYWSLFSPDRLQILRGHQVAVRSVKFNADGTRIASGSTDKTVRLWDSSTAEELAVLSEHGDDVVAVAFNQESTHVASASLDGTVRLWDSSTGDQAGVLQHGDEMVVTVAFSPVGDRLASGTKKGALRLWDSATGRLLCERDMGMVVKCVTFSPDGARLASGIDDGTVHLWDVSSGEFLSRLDERVCGAASIEDIAFSSDGDLLSPVGGKGMCLWNLATGETVASPSKVHSFSSIAFSKNGTRVALGSSVGTVWIADTSTGERILTLRDHQDSVNSVAFSPDGTRLAAAVGDGTVRIRDSVPFKDRYAQYQDILNAAPEAERLVEDLHREAEDWSDVAKQLRDDTTLTAPLRRAALNEVLRRASGHGDG